MSWFASLSFERKGLFIYGLILLAWLLGFELPSKDVLGWAPWPSTTLTIRNAIRWWHPIAGMVALLLFMLWAHFDRGWNVIYLIATASLIVSAVLVHVFIGAAT
jgi:hypothetical protein